MNLSYKLFIVMVLFEKINFEIIFAQILLNNEIEREPHVKKMINNQKSIGHHLKRFEQKIKIKNGSDIRTVNESENVFHINHINSSRDSKEEIDPKGDSTKVNIDKKIVEILIPLVVSQFISSNIVHNNNTEMQVNVTSIVNGTNSAGICPAKTYLVVALETNLEICIRDLILVKRELVECRSLLSPRHSSNMTALERLEYKFKKFLSELVTHHDGDEAAALHHIICDNAVATILPKNVIFLAKILCSLLEVRIWNTFQES